MTHPKVRILLLDSYLAAVRNSIGTKMFRALFAEVGGKRRDIAKRGELSCALYVSALLLFFELIKERHATVSGTLKDMRRYGWRKIRKPRPGAVLHWEPLVFGNEKHEHLGFYMGNGRAASNSYLKGAPITHHWTFGGKAGKPRRRIVGIFWHPKLKN